MIAQPGNRNQQLVRDAPDRERKLLLKQGYAQLAGAASGLAAGLGFFFGSALLGVSGWFMFGVFLFALVVGSLVGAGVYHWRMGADQISEDRPPNPSAGTALREATDPSAAPRMDPVVGDELKRLIARDGTLFLDDIRRWESLLRENCPHSSREVASLIGALRVRIPQRLLAAGAATVNETMVNNCALQLRGERGLDAAAARWAVQAWTKALILVTD